MQMLTFGTSRMTCKTSTFLGAYSEGPPPVHQAYLQTAQPRAALPYCVLPPTYCKCSFNLKSVHENS